ncbi:hypothetical protein OIDMADRAFT_34563 [Oidiodendron maius Zn]|uniref:GPI anchored protein n=1 Tax=Oidiodendron maius (strain Zn) TaxID=913774 RepID=A0A0C3GT15_OIDMZ|nr:hypothetical protein OIDMADRAFT_34563 [Oidiodendron maius Zn]
MYTPTFALGLLVSAVAADYTTTLLLLGQPNESLVGSVIASDATATTYSLDCAATVDPDICGVPSSFSFTQGPSTMHFSVPTYDEIGSSEVIDIQCQITSNGGPCTYALISAGTTSTQTVTTYANFGSDAGAQAVTITAGAEPGASNTAASASATATTSTAAGENTGSSIGSSSTASGGATAAGSSAEISTKSTSSSSIISTKASTGGVPIITGGPQWIIGGAAAAVMAIAGV